MPPMKHPRVGEVRPSQVIFSYGVGALIDLPHLSVLVMGLDDWTVDGGISRVCLLYTSPSPRDRQKSRMPSSA